MRGQWVMEVHGRQVSRSGQRRHVPVSREGRERETAERGEELRKSGREEGCVEQIHMSVKRLKYTYCKTKGPTTKNKVAFRGSQTFWATHITELTIHLGSHKRQIMETWICMEITVHPDWVDHCFLFRNVNNNNNNNNNNTLPFKSWDRRFFYESLSYSQSQHL